MVNDPINDKVVVPDIFPLSGAPERLLSISL